MIDPDEWAKEDCACGHRRYAHRANDGACTRTRRRRVEPERLTWSGEGFGAEPSVPLQDWPIVEGACDCRYFAEAGPVEEPSW